MTGAGRRRRRALLVRSGLFLAMAGGAALTGWWWDHARHDGLDVGADLTITTEPPADGGPLVVREELTFDEGRLGEEELVRTIDPPDGGRVDLASLDAHDPDGVRVEPRADDGLTLVVEADASSPVVLVYEVDGAAEAVDLGTLNAPVDGVAAFTSLGAIPARPDDADPVPWNGIGLTVGGLAGLAWAVSVLRTHRGRPTLAAGGDGLPSDDTPAEVGWLLRYGRVTIADLAATIVDLTARGFVLPYRRDGGLLLGFGRAADGLAAHEALVHDWLFPGWAREADLAATQAAITATPRMWPELWDRFVTGVEEAGWEDGLLERDVASPAVLAVATAGLAVLVAGVIGTANGYAGWLACVVVGSLIVAGATAFARRSAEGEELAARWEAFGAALQAGGEVTPHGLAYAVALGEDTAAAHHVVDHGEGWPAQLVHAEVERQVTGWREAYLTATSVRGQPSERVRAFLSLRALRRGWV